MLTLLLGIVLGALIYYILIKPTQFWAERNIAHVRPWPIVGNMWDCVSRKRHFFQIPDAIYKQFSNHRYVGYHQFAKPVLLIRDLDLIKQIGVKEFESFHDHQPFANLEVDPLLSKSLIHLRGDKWKLMRATLSPVFTSSKMKTMYQFMGECAENITEYFQGKEGEDFEMKNMLTRFANDVIASTAFGIPVNAVKDPKNKFYVMGQKLTEFDVVQLLKVFLFEMSTKLSKLLKIKVLDQDIANYFSSIIKDNIHKRLNENIVRKDLIHLLLEARKGKLKYEAPEGKEEGFATVQESHIGRKAEMVDLTDDNIAAQAFLFFFAGFDTVSTASSFMAHELAVNPEIQKKLQEEIDSVKEEHGEKIPYEAILSMKYLDQVVCESLRKWPPAFQTDRYCNNDYVIQPKKPHERTLVLEKNVLTIIPIMSLHHDPQYFPHPEQFNPERFNDENKVLIQPGCYLPFGIGPRNCIGSRFALLEIKTLFFHLLAKYDLVPNEKTEIPPKISPKRANLIPDNGLHMTVRLRKSA